MQKPQPPKSRTIQYEMPYPIVYLVMPCAFFLLMFMLWYVPTTIQALEAQPRTMERNISPSQPA